MEFTLHGHNRTTIEPGVVGTAINGTIRLLSDFEVRYLSFVSFRGCMEVYDWEQVVRCLESLGKINISAGTDQILLPGLQS